MCMSVWCILNLLHENLKLYTINIWVLWLSIVKTFRPCHTLYGDEMICTNCVEMDHDSWCLVVLLLGIKPDWESCWRMVGDIRFLYTIFKPKLFIMSHMLSINVSLRRNENIHVTTCTIWVTQSLSDHFCSHHCKSQSYWPLM